MPAITAEKAPGRAVGSESVDGQDEDEGDNACMRRITAKSGISLGFKRA
jgi:hypothetical protein